MPPSCIWTAGFNAFHQLSDHEGDVCEFERFQPDHQDINVLCSSWSSTAVKTGKQIRSLGFQEFTADSPAALASPIGDGVNGLLGFVDSQGSVHLLSDSPEQETPGTTFNPSGGPEAPRISTLAIAGNGKVAITFKQAPNGQLTHVAEFISFETFVKWHKDPSEADNYPAAHHMLPGRPKQLLANGGNFILLMEGGEVYTWGDPRFRTLARPTAGSDSTPADKPGLVEALGGLKI